MSLSKQSVENIRNAIFSVAEHFVLSENATVTDLYFQTDSKNGTLSIFDDDDRELAQTTVIEWKGCSKEQQSVIEKSLRNELILLQKEGLLDKIKILKPYSCSLIDENKETIVDLVYIDDDTLILDQELLKGLDKEMDDFLKHLLDD